MTLSLLEVVAAVQRVKPGVDEELRPVAISDEEAARRKTLSVLRDHEIDVVAFEMRECF